jgi:hypothetical protein
VLRRTGQHLPEDLPGPLKLPPFDPPAGLRHLPGDLLLQAGFLDLLLQQHRLGMAGPEAQDAVDVLRGQVQGPQLVEGLGLRAPEIHPPPPLLKDGRQSLQGGIGIRKAGARVLVQGAQEPALEGQRHIGALEGWRRLVAMGLPPAGRIVIDEEGPAL